MAEDGFKLTIIGVVLSCHSIGSILRCLYGYQVIQRTGHICCFTAFAAILAVVCLVLPMVVERYTWIPLRLVFGFSSAMVFMVAKRWLTGDASSVTKGRVFTVYMVINKGSFGAGQHLLLLGDPSGDRLFMLTTILFGLYLVPIALGSKGAPPNINAERIGPRDLYHHSPVGVVRAAARYSARRSASASKAFPIFHHFPTREPRPADSYWPFVRQIRSTRRPHRCRGRCCGRLRGRDTPLYTRYMAHPGNKLCHRRSKRRRLSDRYGACERPCKSGSHGLDYGRTVARFRRRRQHRSVLRSARDEMGGTRRVVPILFRDLRVACGIYLLSADAPRPGTRDDRLRGKAADLAVERCRCRPRSKNRRYRIARGGLILCTKDRGGPPGEDRLPNPFHPLENRQHP